MGRGRPLKLTPATAARIAAAVAAGAPRAAAAQSAGVSVSALLSWLARGRREESGVFKDLLEAVKAAEANFVVLAVGQIRLAADKHWQAAAWLLERRHPELFGQQRDLLRQLVKDVKELRRGNTRQNPPDDPRPEGDRPGGGDAGG